ncbi:MAG: AEC family transporter [Rhodobacteraceae bacterium]|nr:AEC family transporter [Paracoccaceae bacterium]
MIQTLLDVILPVFLVIGVGYTLTRSGYLNESHIDGIMKFSQGVAIPCLLFIAISTLDLSVGFSPVLILTYYSVATLCFFAGMIGARLIFRREWEDCVVIGFCCLFSNLLLMGLPITERAYGADSLIGTFAIISVHSPFCYCLGITVMEIVRNRGKGRMALLGSTLLSMFKNVLIIAIALGFIVNFTGLAVPAALNDAVKLIAGAGLPGALFALGGVLVRYKPEGDLRVIAFIMAISLMVFPALVWGLGASLSLPQDLFRSAVIGAAMAPGFNAYIFANIYGRAKRVAATSVLMATGLSLFTVWFWLGVLG